MSVALMNNFYLLLSISAASYVLTRLLKRRSQNPLPPGPKGYPIIGNAFGIPHHHAYFQYGEWAKQHGDVISYNTFGHTTIILNSLKAATELLDKRSSNYSDRPRMIMANELMGWSWDFARMHYGESWRRHRRVFHQYFQPQNLASYYHFQEKSTANLLQQLSRTPDKSFDHVRQLVGSAVLRIAYGYEVQEEDDIYVDLVHKAMLPLLEVVHAGTYLVEYLPFLKHVPNWLPGAAFKRKAADGAIYATDVLEVPFGNVQKELNEGIAQQSFVADNLQKIKMENLPNAREQEEIVKNCAGVMYLAGSDTTVALILAWQLAMVHFPEVQQRAYMEIDKVVGKSRLPEFNDRPIMPYIEAMVLETLRWHAITPLSVPHRAVYDDEYNGYHIPAGATVTPNAWAILHDPDMYPDPFKFQPERFLDERQERVTFDKQPDPTIVGTFGYGRRVCPGRHLAMSTGWIAMSNILAVYQLSKKIDGQGNVIEPKIEFKDGLVSHPEPYTIQFTPRSEDVFKLIESSISEFA